MKAFDVTRGYAPLVKAIRLAQQARGVIKARRSKNGTPDARKETEEEDSDGDSSD